MPTNGGLTELTACPRCDKTPLSLRDQLYFCSACKTEFPNVGGIPWLFADLPQAPDRQRSRAGRNPPDSGVQADRHLAAARRLAKAMRRLPDHSAEQTRTGQAICRHLIALLEDALLEDAKVEESSH